LWLYLNLHPLFLKGVIIVNLSFGVGVNLSFGVGVITDVIYDKIGFIFKKKINVYLID